MSVGGQPSEINSVQDSVVLFTVKARCFLDLKTNKLLILNKYIEPKIKSTKYTGKYILNSCLFMSRRKILLEPDLIALTKHKIMN